MSVRQLTWSAANRPSPLAQRFPAFQIDAADVQSGAVKVLARAPSGKRRNLDVQVDNSGQFTTNFVPDEIGDWLISILYNGKNIQGSPFNVRVFDPGHVRVFGLEGGCTGQAVRFTVDACGAGDGQLRIQVTHNDMIIPTQITKKGKQYSVAFMPEGSGMYHIQVCFANMEVEGSPFVVEITNPIVVTVSGDGLSTAKVGQRTFFLVNTGRDGVMKDIVAKILSPGGANVPCCIVDNGGGIYRVDYTPNEIGNYMIDVLFCGKIINGCPFTCQVFDNGRIFVRNLPQVGFVGRSICFDIDAEDSGSGKMEILINNGDVPCEVQKKGTKQFTACFVPCAVGPHFIHMRFNGCEVVGSPWKVDVTSADHVTTTAGSLCMVPVSKAAFFEVCTKPMDGTVSINILSPSRKVVPCSISKTNNFTYRVDFTPTEIGHYEINVLYEDIFINGNPFGCIAYDFSAVKVSACRSVVLGKTVDFTVDASNAGLGDLEIKVNHGTVPVTAQQMSAGIYAASFFPKTAGKYMIDLCFNGMALPESPVMVTVIDPRQIKLNGGCNQMAPVGRLFSLTVDSEVDSTGCAELVAKITGPGGNSIVNGNLTGNATTGYTVQFTPTVPGPHTIDITYGGEPVPCSPVIVNAYDISRIRVMGVKDGIVCKKSDFIVDINDCGEGELEVVVMSCNGRPILNQVDPIAPGRLEVSYVPAEAGYNLAQITFNKEPLPGSPFKFLVRDPNRVNARGDGLVDVQCNQLATFFINAPNASVSDIDVQITGPTGRDVMPMVTEKSSGNFRVDYTPMMAGIYQVNINYFDQPICGSPFQVKAWDPTKILIANVTQGCVGVESFFNIELRDAGDGTLEITITDPTGQLIPNNVTTTTPGLLQVHYEPRVRGMHQIMVTMNRQTAPVCPVVFNVIDSSKVSVKGDGLGLVPCKVPTSVMISCPDSKLKDFDVKVTGPDGSELMTMMNEINGSNYKLDYTPMVVGLYNISITYGCRAVSGSPFTARAWDVSKVVVADVGMGLVGCRSSFKVLVAEAGEGIVEISIFDPSGRLVPNQAVADSPGVVEVSFAPSAMGMYKGSVLFNKQAVPGSPFTFMVIDPTKVVMKGDGLGFVPVKRPTSFVISAPYATSQNLEVSVQGPNGQDVPINVTDSGNYNFRVDYTPMISGDYTINGGYFCNPIPSCPVVAKAWDCSKVICSGIDLGRVGHQSCFTVDVKEAGEGNLEISIQGPTGQMLENVVSAYGRVLGVFQVSCLPTVAGSHRANILFNGCNVTGSPFVFMVSDPSQAMACGDGLGIVRCNRPTNFTIHGPAALSRDVHVKIIGPNGSEIRPKVRDQSAGVFGVEYVPPFPGEYQIEVRYFDELIKDSPFTSVGWDSSLVSVNNIRPGVIGRPSSFNIDASKAGPGNLEIAVVAKGESIPTTAHTAANPDLIEASFTPVYLEIHLINVRFNGEPICGSPFPAPVLDGSLATACGQGLGRVKACQATKFDVVAKAVGGEADLDVMITSPNGQRVPATITGSYCNGYQVEYTPVDAGQLTIVVKYADVCIKDSPFHPEVYDSSQVHVSQIPCGIVGKPVTFRVDASMAGPGRVNVSVKGQQTRPHVDMSADAQNVYSVTFVPTEGAVHSVSVKFNDCDVCGSPFHCNVIDQKSLHVRWDSCLLRPVGCPVLVEMDVTTSPDMDAVCDVIDPSGRPVASGSRKNGSVYGFQFVPEDVGPYTIDLHYGCEAVPGAPFVCNVYDAKRVKIVDVSPCGNVGQEASFTVDTSEAGLGALDVAIVCAGTTVPVRQETNGSLYRFVFVPRSPADHVLNIAFNKENVTGSPLVWCIVNPAGQMTLSNGNASKSVCVGQIITGIIMSPGIPINPSDIKATATAPSGEMLPVRITPQEDGSIRLEYTSMFTGTHSLQAEYACQLVPGSPQTIEVSNPNKIHIEGARCGDVMMPMTLDVIREDAGMADLSITINDPSGMSVPFDVARTATGEQVTYVPTDPGTYKINMTFGGCDVPGCPIRQEIRAVLAASACGDGLLKGVVDHVQSFIVDPKGQKGELLVQIQGPSTTARVQIEPVEGGKFQVNYLPVEAGIYTVNMMFNGHEVDGCSFHPRICDASKVEVVDDWTCWSDPEHVEVKLNDMKTLRFDISRAGPGCFSAKIEGPDGNPITADVLPIGMDAFDVKFVPRKPGDYYIRVCWCDMPINRYPIIATAPLPEPPPPPPSPPPPPPIIVCPEPPPPPEPQPPPDPLIIMQMLQIDEPPAPAPAPSPPLPPPPPPPCDPTQVVVSGPGLCMAQCYEPAHFLADGANAGPGMPSAKLIGLKGDIDVDMIQLENNLFAGTYMATLPGAYLLTISWCDQQVPRSPFKVNVLPSGDPSKVVCIGEGLKCGCFGKEINAVVDTRRAGLGEVTAQCQGPTKPAFCELDDRKDCTFELIIKPQEIGQHTLQIKFNGENVPGSPFTLMVMGPPDASKVRASGSGLQNGILATFESQFLVDTTGAGNGQLTVKVRGKKGAFRVEMKRNSQTDRTINCRYNPTEIGDYFINVQWSGQHIPGSPFHVTIVDTMEELRRLKSSSAGGMPMTISNGNKFGTMHSDMNDGFTFMD